MYAYYLVSLCIWMDFVYGAIGSAFPPCSQKIEFKFR